MSSPGPSLEESLSGLSAGDQSYPTPPRVHWFALILIGGAINIVGHWLSRRTAISQLKELFSSEVFLYFWLCVQASFVQRLKAGTTILFTTLMAGALLFAAFLIGDQPRFAVAAGFLAISGSILLLVDLFRMRNILEDHYSKVEQYGLLLNGIWLFFLGPIYLQYHLLKIAMWKDQAALKAPSLSR